MELKQGAMVTPNVRLERLLGKGAMGAVWAATHTTLDTEVAVKFISTALADQREQAIERFEREARAAAKIKSPHVVHTYDHGLTDEGTPYIVMELLEGETLGERLRRGAPVDRALAALIVRQVCKALDKAHELGIVHRDVKPDNIFLTGTGEDTFVKVLDFGIAKETRVGAGAAGMTSTGTIIGTPQYMSPEQIKSSRSVDAKADLWALAVVAYVLITGHVPFPHIDEVGGLLVAICSDDIPPPSQVRASGAGGGHIPPALDAFFAKALHRRADERYPSARELSRAFGAAVGGPAERPSEPERAHPLGVAATAVGAPSPGHHATAVSPGAGATVVGPPPVIPPAPNGHLAGGQGSVASSGARPASAGEGRGLLPIVAVVLAAGLGVAVAALLASGGETEADDTPIVQVSSVAPTASSVGPTTLTAPEGFLTVTCAPACTSVVLRPDGDGDEQQLGAAPERVSVPSGSHVLTAKRDGVEVVRFVSVAAGEHKVEELDMKGDSPATVATAARPAPPRTPPPKPPEKKGGKVIGVVQGGTCAWSVDGVPAGNGSSIQVAVAPGTHKVTCVPVGGGMRSQSVRVTDDQSGMVSFKL